MTHPSPFHFLGCHDDNTGVILPYHRPEVTDSDGKASLSCDVSFLVTFKKTLEWRMDLIKSLSIKIQERFKSARKIGQR
jgi:hypothetical protein